jgi:peptidoglycan/LPS O-acetylase OafA/YrhL
LTGLRFILAAWVVLHHLSGRRMMLSSWIGTLPEPVQNVAHSGYLAVGTFFVLSGFVLARSYAATPWSPSSLIRYGAGRFARVYPVYLLSLLLIVPFVFEDLVAPGRAAIAASQKGWLVADYGLVLQGWTGALPVHWNTPAWSLSCELFFYACFPVAVVVFSRMGRGGIAAAGVLALAAPAWYRLTAVPATWKPVIHAADFLAGIAAAWIYNRLEHTAFAQRRRGYWLYAPAAVAGVLLIAVPGLVPAAIDLNSALRPLNMLLLIGLAIGGGVPVQALSARLAVFLGQASYSMYILHIPLLWWYKRFWLYTSGVLPQTASAAVYFAGVVMASSAAYRIVEEPANRSLRGWVAARLRK